MSIWNSPTTKRLPWMISTMTPTPDGLTAHQASTLQPHPPTKQKDHSTPHIPPKKNKKKKKIDTYGQRTIPYNKQNRLHPSSDTTTSFIPNNEPNPHPDHFIHPSNPHLSPSLRPFRPTVRISLHKIEILVHYTHEFPPRPSHDSRQ